MCQAAKHAFTLKSMQGRKRKILGALNNLGPRGEKTILETDY